MTFDVTRIVFFRQIIITLTKYDTTKHIVIMYKEHKRNLHSAGYQKIHLSILFVDSNLFSSN